MNFDKWESEEIFKYYTTQQGKSELFELVPLLPEVMGGDKKKVNSVMIEIKKGRILKAYYPAIDKEAPKGRYLGEICDGALYLI